MLQKPFLQSFHVEMKMHLPLPLEYEVVVSSIGHIGRGSRVYDSVVV